MIQMAKLTTRKQLGDSIDMLLFEELTALSKESRIPRSRLLDEAIELLLIKHNRELPIEE